MFNKSYLRKKLPGQQTILDFCLQDGIVIWMIRMLWTNLCFYIPHVLGSFSINTGSFMVFIHVSLLMVQIGFVQICLMVKVLLIYKGDWISEFSDKTVMWSFRAAMLVYPLFFYGFEQIFSTATNSSPSFLLYHLTGSNESQ